MKIKVNRKFSVFCFLLLVPIVISCSAPITQMLNEVNSGIKSNECLSPLYGDFSYPVEANDENIAHPGLDMFVLPPSPWQAETPLPEIDGMTNWDQKFINVIQTRDMGDYFEIWIYLSRGAEEGYLAVYRTDAKTWKVLPERINTLFVDKSGSLWGSHFEGSILGGYDERQNAFVPDENVKSLPTLVEDNAKQYSSRVLLDGEGIFWILVPKDGIYKYDPVSSKVEMAFDLQEAFRDAKIAPDGTIYVLVYDELYQDGKLQVASFLNSYIPKTGEEGGFALLYDLEPYPLPQSMFIDHKSRIWLDNVAYRENDTWYQIQRSPLFVSPIREAYSDYRYKRAKVVLESSDGRLWFLHPNNGMISLDPQKGEWCWFTTYQSNIVEDSDHNLWMIADGKLYKLALGE